MKMPWASTPRDERADEDAMTLTEHLAELRARIVRSLLAVALGTILLLAFYDTVLDFLLQPYENLCERKPDINATCNLFALGPLEGFTARFRISAYGGIILASPVILWQIWRFIVPALHAKEKRYAIPFMASTIALFILGGTLAYVTLDKALEFLIGWSGSDVQNAFQISKYVSLVTAMIAAFGIGFEFPVLLVFLQLVGVVTPAQLLKQWRMAIMIIFVAAAVITPSGDPISLLFLSIPMCILYFVAVLVGHLVLRRRETPPLAR
jgi:sec-independent protein translocase protein TatC